MKQTHLPFLKMNGLGNEITVVDLRGRADVISARQARVMAARKQSRFDQLMVLYDAQTPGTGAFVRIYNADGSEAEACGNGNRCVGWLLAGESGNRDVAFETRAGIIRAAVTGRETITVDMGEPLFGWRDIPLAREMNTNSLDFEIAAAGAPLQGPSAVNVGNPHCIFWVEDAAAIDLASIGPQVEHHPLFPERVNVSFAQVYGANHVRLRVWERGAGATKACGTAACATAVVAVRRGYTDRAVRVDLPGGTLHIEWQPGSNRILMTGPVELNYEGSIDLDELKEESIGASPLSLV